MSVAGPPAPPPGWWIMKRVFGRQTRRSFGAARNTCVPALATQPVPTVVTGARTKRMMSWIASPDSTWPPGDEISMLMGASDSSASAIRRVQVARASACVISPNSMTKRDLKASRSAIASMRSPASGFSSLVSMDTPVRWRRHGTPLPARCGEHETPAPNQAVAQPIAPGAPALYFFAAMTAKRFTRPSDLGLAPGEFAVLRRLDTPQKIQAYLLALKQNFEHDGESCRPVREVIRTGRAHCIEGAMLAAAALWAHGEPPLLLDMRAEHDFDHVVAIFKRHGRWGAISKTNGIGLRWRDPVYRSLRELAMSYFHEYYNGHAHKTLREYSVPYDLRRMDASIWVSGTKNCWVVGEKLDEIRHFKLVNGRHLKAVTRRDPFERRIGVLGQYRKPRALLEKLAQQKKKRKRRW